MNINFNTSIKKAILPLSIMAASALPAMVSCEKIENEEIMYDPKYDMFPPITIPLDSATQSKLDSLQAATTYNMDSVNN